MHLYLLKVVPHKLDLIAWQSTEFLDDIFDVVLPESLLENLAVDLEVKFHWVEVDVADRTIYYFN